MVVKVSSITAGLATASPGRELGAAEHGRLLEAVAEIGAPRASRRPARAAGAASPPPKRGRRHLAEGDEAHAGDLRLLGAARVAVLRLVAAVERLDGASRAARRRGRRDRRVRAARPPAPRATSSAPGSAGSAGSAPSARCAGSPRRRGSARRARRAPRTARAAGRDRRAARSQIGALLVDGRLRGERAERREGRRRLRHQHAVDAELLRPGSPRRPGRCRRRRAARARAGRCPCSAVDAAHGLGHVGVDDAPAVEGRLLDRVAERAARRASANASSTPSRVSRKLPPANSASLGEEAEHERSRRSPSGACRRARSRPGPGSAPALAGPTWSTPLAHVADRAAAGAERLDAHHRQPDHVAVVPVPARLRRAPRRRAPPRRRSWCRPCRRRAGPARPSRRRSAAPPITPPAGPEARTRTGARAQVLARHHAAARLHHQQLAREARRRAAARSAGRGSR